MDIAILNYATGSVDIIRGLNEDFIEAAYEGDIDEYLYDCGYDTSDIYYLVRKEIKINEIKPEDI